MGRGARIWIFNVHVTRQYWEGICPAFDTLFQKLYALANPQHSAVCWLVRACVGWTCPCDSCYNSDTAAINIRHGQKILPNKDAALQRCPTKLTGRDIFGFVGSWERCVAVVPLLVFARAPVDCARSKRAND